ncbi:MAG: methionine biosynthesis protein MetW [Gammaproteobacteria bacterium]|nr:methionine biosynthesis protein MetW [Gammaproteobacteria bacterium]
MTTLRPDQSLIAEWIAPSSRVLDLGCGDGTLLAYLQATRQVTGYGLEIDEENIVNCIAAGVNVIQTDLDAGLSEFDEDSFDYVVMTNTLQAVHYPEKLINEMLRIGREGIITFPNFGHWVCRLQLALKGKMPISRTLPNEWYDTPNIHLCSIADFEELCGSLDIAILQRATVDNTHRSSLGMRLLPNLLGEIALYRFRRRAKTPA